MPWSAYFRLMRFHKPVGIILLWVPTAWALWIANQGCPALLPLLYFLVGTIVMRAAGCVMNDIADRHIDKHVKRTQQRPLTNGEISLSGALITLISLLFVALLIVIQLPKACFYYALIAVCLTIIYPFCKRFIQAPQLVLGLAFSMGIPMAFTTAGIIYNPALVILCVINFAWILAYDTMYAMVDKEDDLRIGVHSTAILFAQYDTKVILSLQIFFQCAWFFLALYLQFSKFFVFWALASCVLIFQQKLINTRQIPAYFKAFRLNNAYGLLIWAGLIVDYTKIG